MQYQNKTGNQRPFSVNNPFRNISQTQQDVSLKQYETDEEFQQWVKQNQQFANGSNNNNNNNNNNRNSPYNSQNYGRPRANRSNSSFLSQRSSAFYDDEFFDQYDEGNSNNNTHYSNEKENGNKLEFQPPKSIYQQRNTSTHSVNSNNSMNRKNPFLEDTDEMNNNNNNNDYYRQRQEPVQMNHHIPQQQHHSSSTNNNNSNYRSTPPPRGGLSNNHPTASEEKERMKRQYEINDRLLDDLPPSYDEIAPAPKHIKPTGDVKVRNSSNNTNGNSSRTPSRHRSGNNRERSDSHHNKSSNKKEHAPSSSTSGNGNRKTKKPVVAKNVDTIDKLDVTGLFGGAFHHDGPFDACTPHRNKNKKAAPVLAFPKDGPNSTLAGKTSHAAGYQTKMDQVFGLSNEYRMDDIQGDNDDDNHVYSLDNSKMTQRGRKGEYLNVRITNISTDTLQTPNSPATIDAVKNNNSVHQLNTNSAVKIHGFTSQGLGSTTFLDGAPASRDEVERQQKLKRSLSRKKSVSQRLGLKHDEDEYTSSNISKIRSDGDDFDKPKSSGNKLLRRVKTLGRRS